MIGRGNHDPERAAAKYLSGNPSPRARRRLEEHLLECEECWAEVRLAREGRRLAELARELAPPALRENIRAAVSLSASGAPASRRPQLVAAAVALLALLILAPIGSVPQPAQISAALQAYRTGVLVNGGVELPAPDLSSEGLTLVESGRANLGGLAADSYVFDTAGGNRVALFMSASPFPPANGARGRSGMQNGWTATSNGISLVCGVRPQNYLLVGQDRALLEELDITLSSQPPSFG